MTFDNSNKENKKVGKIGLLTSSYPPQIDGVSNTVWNYSGYLEKNHEGAVVFAPKVKMPEVESPSKVIRYAAIDTTKKYGYPFGLPVSPSIVNELRKTDVSLLHMHDPLISALIGRELTNLFDMPKILTYNTKYDIDIKELVHHKATADFVINAVKDAALAADEVWVVSKGAGDNLRSLGYEGETVVMRNGVDMPKGRASDETVRKYCKDLPENIPLFLFVGRIIKAKGIFTILSAMRILKARGIDFRMVFIGNGRDLDELRKEAENKKLTDVCLFLGKIDNREELSAWYTRADLFLFPSEYDTNGLVVTEAAASSTPSLLIKGSAAAENVKDGVNGFLCENTAEDMADKICSLLGGENVFKTVGEGAARDLYLSWEDAVDIAYERYGTVIDNYKSGKYTKKKLPGDGLLKISAEYMSVLAKILR